MLDTKDKVIDAGSTTFGQSKLIERAPVRMPDELDLQIIEALKLDPQATNKAIAGALGVSETSIAQRIRSMSEDNIMRVVAQRDIYAGPYSLTAVLSVELQNMDLQRVGESIAQIQEVISVSVGTRRPRLIVGLRAKDRQHLDALIREKIGRVTGVRAIETHIMLKIFKYITGFGLLALKMPTHLGDHGGDEKDESIIAALLEDGRMSNREIARRLNISESNVRQRLKKMSDERRMRLGVICDSTAVGKTVIASGLLKIEMPEADAVISKLISMESVGYVSSITGAYNLFTVVQAADIEELNKIYFNEISNISGVLDVEIELYATGMKQRYDLIRIRD
ncbi:MAG: Lrp/AsnC family transcriptional regulator [Pseudomonadota bacterium]